MYRYLIYIKTEQCWTQTTVLSHSTLLSKEGYAPILILDLEIEYIDLIMLYVLPST